MTSNPVATIEVRVREIRQLFNSLDATPFPDTDLDADAEEFILGWAMEFKADRLLKIRIHVEHFPEQSGIAAEVAEALRCFFAYRAETLQRRFHRLMAHGRQRLLIGLLCLAASVAGAELISLAGKGTLLGILRESLIIGGWVAMWGPLDLLLYNWRPVWQEKNVCERLAQAEVELVPGPPSPEQLFLHKPGS